MTDCRISVASPQLTARTTTAFTRAAEQAPSLSRDQAPVDVLTQRYGGSRGTTVLTAPDGVFEAVRRAGPSPAVHVQGIRRILGVHQPIVTDG
jgi:hypothetical protein